MYFLTTAIENKAKADSDLIGSVKAFRFLEVDQKTKCPYITYKIINEKGLYTFSGNGEDVLIEFSIFSDNKYEKEISEIYFYLDRCFDNKVLVFAAGYECVSCIRTGASGIERVEDNCLMKTVEFRIKIRGV